MSRQQIKIDYNDHDLEFDVGLQIVADHEIHVIVAKLLAAQTAGATHIYFSGNCYGGDLEDVYLYPVSVRAETDDEMKQREREKLQNDTYWKERRRKEYEVLKKEFEPNS